MSWPVSGCVAWLKMFAHTRRRERNMYAKLAPSQPMRQAHSAATPSLATGFGTAAVASGYGATAFGAGTEASGQFTMCLSGDVAASCAFTAKRAAKAVKLADACVQLARASPAAGGAEAKGRHAGAHGEGEDEAAHARRRVEPHRRERRPAAAPLQLRQRRRHAIELAHTSGDGATRADGGVAVASTTSAPPWVLECEEEKLQAETRVDSRLVAEAMPVVVASTLTNTAPAEPPSTWLDTKEQPVMDAALCA